MKLTTILSSIPEVDGILLNVETTSFKVEVNGKIQNVSLEELIAAYLEGLETEEEEKKDETAHSKN